MDKNLLRKITEPKDLEFQRILSKYKQIKDKRSFKQILALRLNTTLSTIECKFLTVNGEIKNPETRKEIEKLIDLQLKFDKRTEEFYCRFWSK